MIFKEFGGVGVLPFSEEVALGGADDVHGVGDARHGVFTDSEDGELDGGDALVDSLVLGAVEGVVPSGKDVCGAEGGHQFMAEEIRFETLLYCEELGVDILVTLPDVVGVAELANDVERGEHGGGEVVIKARACQSRSCWSVSCLGTEPTRLEWSANFIIMLSLFIKK